MHRYDVWAYYWQVLGFVFFASIWLASFGIIGNPFRGHLAAWFVASLWPFPVEAVLASREDIREYIGGLGA